MDEAADVEMSSNELPFDGISTEDPTRIREFGKKMVEKWKERYEKGLLTSIHFEEQWRMWVPKIYSPSLNESCLNWIFNEDLAQDILFNTLDEFICNGDPTTVLKQLSELDKAPSVCGRVFKFGEPTYSCRECGMDKTCVLCVECFKNSEHRNHKYKMSTSCGGGCCDCGDVEAWKKDPFCTIHIVGIAEEQQSRGLPEDIKERTRIVFEAAIWYAYRLLSTEQVADIRLEGSTDYFFDIDNYCTILYNDEVHTFEQVINTLTRVLKCNQRSSTEYVTNIDREGRAIVKCSNYQHCFDLKQEIEKYTSRHGNKPLRVLVSHAHAIAHQIYAMKLLTWLEKFLGQGEGFRDVFAKVMLKPKATEPCVIKGILQRDSTLWKSARTQWHRLLISGMLMEYENKKALAKIFTKNYGQVMKDFVKDDHDHTFSVSSLSVQLFTVPTLVHHLIAYDDVLYILLNTFISECGRKCNKAGKLEFERSPSGTFKRSLVMLYDLRYLLSAIPEKWTDDLRRSFLHGLSLILSLLTLMQGMDVVTRQVGQHMEYEPEWESGFNLHIKLAYCISLAIEWCGSDKIVLVKAYRSVLKKLEENPCYEPNEAGEARELADHSTACLHYDVSSKPVSIHLPLTRFLAALHLYLEKFNLHFDGSEFQVSKPTPVQIMEPVLRAQVMVAQVSAGMWRRNGYALLNTLFFYHNVKCRTEMLDRDITLLQIAASLIESNEFLIHVLNKFNLINWAMSDFEINSLKSPEEDSIRQTINLVEELLHLLIVVVGERHMPGVSKVTVEDRIRKEVIQHLCIKPLPHSELIKTIPDDLTSREIAVDEVVQEVADFKKPTHGTGKGVYKLKEQYYDEFNVFFYHYTREEQSKSEEAQRKRHKALGELECCPPPKLPKLNESFGLLVNLLQCDVMLHVMQTVLERCVNLRARSFSESQFHKVLHLIGYALLEEESKNYPFFKFIENSTKYKLFALLEELLNSPRIDSHKGLLRWTLNKYKQLTDRKEDDFPMMQKEATTSDAADTEKERRSKLAAERRAKVMAQMQAMQNSFITKNASLFVEPTPEPKTRTTSIVETMDVSESLEEEQPIALGSNQSPRQSIEKTYTCILCQEEETISVNGPTMVLAAFVQQATVLCQHKSNETLMDITQHDPLYLHANLGPAPHTSTCGHVMHSDCWRKYFDNIMVREHRRPYRLRHPASFDVDKQEFLCPLCECLSNTVLPLLPALNSLQPSPPKIDISFEEFITNISQVLSKKQKVCHGIFKCDSTDECKNKHCSVCIYASNGTNIEPPNVDCEVNCMLQPHQVFYSYELDAELELSDKFKQLFHKNVPFIDEPHKEMIQVFTQVAYTRGLNVNPHPTDKRLGPMSWKTLAYTIHSIEVLLREMHKPLLGHLSSRHRDAIENLVRVVGALGCTWTSSVFINSHAIHLLSILFEHGNEGPSVLQWDSLGLLVSLTFSLPSLSCKSTAMPIPTGSALDLHVLKVIFLSHVVKILVLMNVDCDSSMDTDAKDHAEMASVLKLLGKCSSEVSTHAVWENVQYACLPFLRCCVLFYHYLTEVSAPAVLTEHGGDTFSNMCTYLDLPQTPKEIFGSAEATRLMQRWCSHEDVVTYLAGTPLDVIHEPFPVPQLIDLPTDYSELINTVSTFTCPNSDEDSKNPCMCLVCGEILCSQSYCCQTEMNKIPVGACNHHANKCGAGIGIFLRVRECEILFLAAPHRGCFLTPPYLDDYGETDQGLRRGNPLRLCRDRYKKLQSSWLSHSIHEEIARSIETNSHIVATQWNLL